MLRKGLIGLALVIVVAGAVLTYLLNDRPSLDTYSDSMAPAWAGEPGVQVTFLGVSTLLISDGVTHWMTDGFFSRPGLWDLAVGSIEPDLDRISAGLAMANIDELSAVFVLHSHYDHSMDAPAVVERTGAVLVGSPSTANVARGWGLPRSKMIVPEPEVPLSFGDFVVTLIESRHFPHGMAEGTIDEPLIPPASATDYLEGKTYVLHVAHPSGELAIVGSAGFVEGSLSNYRADAVLLGVGGLGKKDVGYRSSYFGEVLGHLRPAAVYPIHYDDFTRPLTEPLAISPRLLDDFDVTMSELDVLARRDGFTLELLPLAKPVSVLR